MSSNLEDIADFDPSPVHRLKIADENKPKISLLEVIDDEERGSAKQSRGKNDSPAELAVSERLSIPGKKTPQQTSQNFFQALSLNDSMASAKLKSIGGGELSDAGSPKKRSLIAPQFEQDMKLSKFK